jgi:hypothetical protein
MQACYQADREYRAVLKRWGDAFGEMGKTFETRSPSNGGGCSGASPISTEAFCRYTCLDGGWVKVCN